MAALSKFYGSASVKTQEIFARNPITWRDARSLAANTAESHTVPDGATQVVFSGTTNFYALANGTAAVPGDVTDGSAAELNPLVWLLDGVATIGLIAPAACVVTMTFYK